MGDAFSLILTGFSVVMVVLAALWGACAAVGYFFTQDPLKVGQKAEKQAQVPSSAAAPAASSGVPPEHLAAIAAAVATTLGSGYVVRNVAAPAHKVLEWPMEGRTAIFASHVTRHGWGAQAPTRLGD